MNIATQTPTSRVPTLHEDLPSPSCNIHPKATSQSPSPKDTAEGSGIDLLNGIPWGMAFMGDFNVDEPSPCPLHFSDAQILSGFLHMFFWLSALQVAIFYSSGANQKYNGSFNSPDMLKGDSGIRAKSFAIVLAHMTGFASINAWGAPFAGPKPES